MCSQNQYLTSRERSWALNRHCPFWLSLFQWNLCLCTTRLSQSCAKIAKIHQFWSIWPETKHQWPILVHITTNFVPKTHFFELRCPKAHELWPNLVKCAGQLLSSFKKMCCMLFEFYKQCLKPISNRAPQFKKVCLGNDVGNNIGGLVVRILHLCHNQPIAIWYSCTTE